MPHCCNHARILGGKTFVCISTNPHTTRHVMVAEDRTTS